jgi:carboxymethylenebutenolidase
MDRRKTDRCDRHWRCSQDRREFLKRLSILVGGAAVTNALAPMFESGHAEAQGAVMDDGLLKENVEYPGGTGAVRAMLARPKGDGKHPAVIVIHENRGLNGHIKDVAGRVALEGFIALAPDALSPLGGTPDDEDKARAMIGQLDERSTINNFLAAVKYLNTHPYSTGKVGVIGFCWGGGMANQLAVNSPDLVAAVPFYGRQPALEDVPKIKASLLLHYAGSDEGINKGIPAYEAALKKAGVDYVLYVYEGTQHAFHNDTSRERYNKEAARLAWSRTISFLKEKLKT